MRYRHIAIQRVIRLRLNSFRHFVWAAVDSSTCRSCCRDMLPLTHCTTPALSTRSITPAGERLRSKDNGWTQTGTKHVWLCCPPCGCCSGDVCAHDEARRMGTCQAAGARTPLACSSQNTRASIIGIFRTLRRGVASPQASARGPEVTGAL